MNPKKVDNGIIIDGNHRYIVAKWYGVVPEITLGQIAPSKLVNIKPIEHLTIDPFDWGNH